MRRGERLLMSMFPAGVPVLAVGGHKRPEDGACFMEYASVLAGEHFSDRPRCTHPQLAAVCRLINDLTTDTGRARLVRHVPDVIGANARDPRATVLMALACLDVGETYAPGRFARARARARRRADLLAGGWWARVRARCSGPGYAVNACCDIFDAVRVIADAGGDDALYALLMDTLDAHRRVDTGAPMPALSAGSPMAGPRRYGRAVHGIAQRQGRS